MNPATLHGIDKLAATAVVTPFGPKITSPAAGPETEVESSRSLSHCSWWAPDIDCPTVSSLGRPCTRPAAWVPATKACQVRLGRWIWSSMLRFEAAPAIACAPLKEFSIGLAYRMTYMRQSVTIPTPGGVAKVTLAGTSFVGATGSLFYKPNDSLRFGLLYRSKVTADLDGDSKVGPLTLDTTWSSHRPTRSSSAAPSI